MLVRVQRNVLRVGEKTERNVRMSLMISLTHWLGSFFLLSGGVKVNNVRLV